MTIAIFTDNDFNKPNGVTTTLNALLRHAPPDLTLRIYTLADLVVDEPQYLAFHSMSAPIPYYDEMRLYVPRVRQFRRHVLIDNVRLLHVTMPGPVGLAARWLSRDGIPLVGSFHTNLGDYTAILSGSIQLGRLIDAYMRWFYGPCERVLVPSRDTLHRLVGGGWNGDRLTIWSRGVDTTVFSPARRSSAMRERWRVCERRPAVLYAGRLSREKGLDLLEPLGSLLYRHHIPYRFVIAGDGQMSRELRDKCPDAVFTGKLSQDDLSVAMASADLLVFPSETETAGNIVLEAQACGLPVIVTDTGGAREHMRHGETGYVCRARDAEDFCWRIAELWIDPARRATMQAAARSYAEGRTWAAALQPVYDLYRTALMSSLATRIDRPLPLTGDVTSRR